MRRSDRAGSAAGLAGTALGWAGLVALLWAHAALAERADRDKPVNIESDRMVAEDSKKTATFDGRVVLTQGTLIIRADRIVVQQDAAGFQYGIATGNPATFRQKREGFEEYVDGEALRIEYNGKLERVELFDQSRLRRDGGDDVRGHYISYDAKTEFFTVQSSRDASQQSRDGRVRAVIMPKNRAPEAARQAAPLDLKSVPAIANPRQD